jgi:hypothetical protein
MFNVYKNQLSWQTGSRNLTGPKTLPTIWYTYMTLVTKYQISSINSYSEKCDEKYLGRKEGQTEGWTDRRTEVKQYTSLPRRGTGYNKLKYEHHCYHARFGIINSGWLGSNQITFHFKELW